MINNWFYSLMIVMMPLLKLVSSNYLFFSMTKQLYVPGKNCSSLAVSHQLNSLTPYFYYVNAEFSLSQTTQYNQTNSVFDFFTTTSDPDGFMDCYNSSVSYMNSLYEQFQPCEERCTIPKSMQSLRQNQVSIKIGDGSSQSQNTNYIIDNTFYPCKGGVYLPELFLFQQINVSIEANSTFWMLIKIGCVVLLQILIMLITYIMIMFNKLHDKKSKLLKLKQEEDNKGVLKNFLHSKRNQRILR